jgi:competence ComEA-like helix-hairpin-helix protein
MFRRFVIAYLTFSKKERKAILLLVALVLAISTFYFLVPSIIQQKQYSHTDFEKEIAALKIKQLDTSRRQYANNFDENNYQNYYQPSDRNYNSYKIQGELFYFDPNTATAAEWKRLVLRDKTIATIQNYLSKGGHFYKPEDIGKIWGLHEDEVQRLLPYIQITPKENRYKDFVNNNYDTKIFEKPVYKPLPVDVNAADTSAFIALPGIGSKLAQRIVDFRNKLGGFYKIEQVGETYGLPDSTFQKIKARLTINNALIKQFNINTATIDQMKTHPYIKYALANAIIQYRMQHGNFSSVNDIKKIMIVTDEIFNKASPYLKTD